MKKGFNLLRAKFETPTFWTKAYDWVLNTAKVIIIITELLVVVAFVIRFVIDLQQKELDKKIALKEGIYNSVSIKEQDFLELQEKTSAYSKLVSLIPDYGRQIKDLQVNIPIEANLNNLSYEFSPDGIGVSGRAKKEFSNEIQSLENNLKANTRYFIDTTLTRLVDDGVNLNFTFSTTLKEVFYKSIDGSTQEEETNN